MEVEVEVGEGRGERANKVLSTGELFDSSAMKVDGGARMENNSIRGLRCLP